MTPRPRPKLESRGSLCLYFNAWETDFARDPLVALVGELSAAITEMLSRGKRHAAIRKQLDKTRALATSIVKRSIPVAVRLATAGVLDLEEALEGELANLAADVAKDQIQAYESAKSEVRDFRRALEELVQQAVKLRNGEDSKVVVFVDELDRCRPSYAVELLERIKHLFDVAGVIFVLGIDRRQLTHSVKALYGSEFDADGYLRRFIDIDYRLPQPPPKSYCSHLFEVLGIREAVLGRSSRNPREELDWLEGLLSFLFAASNMSLREQLQTVSRLRVAL